MMKFIKANPLVVGIFGLIVVAAIVMFFSFRDVEKKRIEGKLEEKGASKEREVRLNETLNSVMEANDEREKVTRDDDAGAKLRYDQCLSSARTPANCKRLLPQ